MKELIPDTIHKPASGPYEDPVPISLCGDTWSVVWSRHAKNRTYDRRANPLVAAKCLEKALNSLGPIFYSILGKIDTVFTLRVFPYHSSFVLSVDRAAQKMTVVTYGDPSCFFPRFGDRVVSIAENGNVSITNWKVQTFMGNEPSDKKLLGCVSL